MSKLVEVFKPIPQHFDWDTVKKLFDFACSCFDSAAKAANAVRYIQKRHKKPRRKSRPYRAALLFISENSGKNSSIS